MITPSLFAQANSRGSSALYPRDAHTLRATPSTTPDEDDCPLPGDHDDDEEDDCPLPGDDGEDAPMPDDEGYPDYCKGPGRLDVRA